MRRLIGIIQLWRARARAAACVACLRGDIHSPPLPSSAYFFTHLSPRHHARSISVPSGVRVVHLCVETKRRPRRFGAVVGKVVYAACAAMPCCLAPSAKANALTQQATWHPVSGMVNSQHSSHTTPLPQHKWWAGEQVGVEGELWAGQAFPTSLPGQVGGGGWAWAWRKASSPRQHFPFCHTPSLPHPTPA